MASLFDNLCGESGLVNQITDVQNQIREAVVGGKNAISQIKRFASDVETLADTIQNQPGVVERKLQEDIKNILSEEALANPVGAAAQLLEIRDAYQDAGAAIDRVIENVQQFIEDPLNTPLDLCKDIPNIVKAGESVIDLGAPAETPAGPPAQAEEDSLETKTGNSDISTTPRYLSKSVSNSVETAGRYTGELGPGAANQAAGVPPEQQSVEESKSAAERAAERRIAGLEENAAEWDRIAEQARESGDTPERIAYAEAQAESNRQKAAEARDQADTLFG
jgi:polyhydroxyalkanoate synthesis regulator phasin